MKKALGYLVSLIGFIVLLAGVKPTDEYFKQYIPQLASINYIVIIVVGVVIILFGIMMLRKGGRKRSRNFKDLPIYQGKDVVGYRRD